MEIMIYSLEKFFCPFYFLWLSVTFQTQIAMYLISFYIIDLDS